MNLNFIIILILKISVILFLRIVLTKFRYLKKGFFEI